MTKLPLVLGCAMALFATNSFAQLTLDNSGTYSQNFNDIASGLPAGWTVRTGATASGLGTAGAFTATTVSWGSASGFGNVASTIGNGGTVFTGSESVATQGACTNRSLGIKQLSSFGDPGAAFVLQITNTLGCTNFQLSLDFLMLTVSARSTIWTLDYAVGNSPASFTTLAAYSDPSAFGTTHTNVSFGTALDNQTENVWIRVVALSASTGSSTRDTFGIDNFNLTYGAGTATTNPPSITVQPQSRTNAVGTTATFNVAVTGTLPFSYQWKKNGVDLTDAGNVIGSTTTILSVTNVAALDQGTYSCTITNAGGSTNTVGAILTVLDPGIVFQPTSSSNLPGERQVFSVTANGAGPLTFQWLKNGSAIGGATTNFIAVTNISASDVASYSVVISNALGSSVTSSTATLSLLSTPPVRIALWDFNSNPADTTNVTGTTMPSIGSGTVVLLNAVNEAFGFGAVQDPADAGIDNSGWIIDHFIPAASSATSNKTAGVQFNFSTAGYQDIFVTWHERHTSTASRYARMQYSADGTNFTDFHLITRTNTNFDREIVDLSAIPAVADAPNFAMRIVTEFESTAIGSGTPAYVPSSSGSSYSSAGTIRFDWLNVFATPRVRLNAQLVGNNIVLSWTNTAYTLQSAPLVTGTYTNISGATNGYTTAITGPQKFFRLKAN